MKAGGGRRRLRLAAALVLVHLAASGTSLAAPGPAATPAPQRALLDLSINQASQGTVLVLLVGDDAYLDVKALEAAGLERVGGERRSFDGTEMVSLRSLGSVLSFEIDPDSLTLSITADPRSFGSTAVDVRGLRRPEDLRFKSDLSGFLNYSVEAATGAGLGAFTELGASYRTFLFTTGLNRAPGAAHTLRTLTRLTYDQPDALRRWSFGEFGASTGVLGGGGLLAGLGVEKEFSLDPYRTHLPFPQLTGTAATPSRLDVYVNGQFVRSEEVPTGVFELQNLPVPSGAATVRYVLRDAYGRTQEFDSRFYLSSELLAQGETDYGYHLGFTRLDPALESFSFDPHPLLLAHHRMGLTEHLTAGGRVEISPNLLSGGPSLAYGLPFGEVQANLAASLSGYLAGTAAQLSYSFRARRFGGGASAQVQSRYYARAGLLPTDDRQTVSFDVFASDEISSTLLIFGAYRHTSWRDRGSSDALELRATLALNDWGALLFGGRRVSNSGGIPEYSGSLTLAFRFGAQGNAQVATERVGDQTHFSADAQQSLPVGTGLGYRLHGDDQGGSETLTFQSQHGRYEGDYTNEAGNENAQAFASGSLVLVGGSLFAARPVEQSYALVRIPGVPNVRTLLNNQEIGRTNGDGDVLIPNLLPYYGNRLSIVPGDIPLNYEIPPIEQVIATANRGGALVTFKARRIVALSGSVVLREGLLRIPPAYGQLDVRTEDGVQSSPLGKNGEFYLENLPPGDYPAQVHSDAGDCDFVLTIPDRPEKFIDLGLHSCHGKVNTPQTFTQAAK